MAKSPTTIARRGSEALSRLRPFGPLGKGELTALIAIAGPARRVAKGGMIRWAGHQAEPLDLLVRGWAVGAISWSDGHRQLVGINLPGDLVGLAGLAAQDPVDEVVAVSDAVVRSIPLAGLTRLFNDHPRLAAMLFLLALEERALAIERLALMGRAAAKSRLAALFVRLSERVAQLEPAQRHRFDLPLTQQDLADLIGVSTVYVNGILQKMRAEKMIRLTRRELHILDYDRLRDLAGIRQWQQTTPAWLPPMRPASHP